MKLKLFVLALGCGVMSLTSCDKLTSSTKITNQLDSVSYCLGSTFGKNLERSGLSEINKEIMMDAMATAMKGGDLKIDLKDANKIIGDYVQESKAKKASANVEVGAKFLEDNKSKEGVQVTESGLQYKILTPSEGVKPLATDVVKVHYTGKLITGKVFDSSVERGTPAEFPVNRVIPGWTEALQLMTVGSKYELYIPANLAYGERGAGADIGPNSTLIFEVELLGIVKKEEAKK